MTDKKYGKITGWGHYAPPHIVTNQDLEKKIDTNHEWIVQRTGIHERRVGSADETTGTMSLAASKMAMGKAGITANDLDLIIVATSTPDRFMPAVSSELQHWLGAVDVPAFTLTTGCTGFVYALVTAQQFMTGGVYKTILIVGAEMPSKFMNWEDRATAVLFGDGAGAVIMQATDQPCGVGEFDMGSDGSGGDHLSLPAMGSAEPITADTFASGRQFIHMNGREVFKFASRIMSNSSKRVLERAGLTPDDIDYFVPHQANLRIIQSAARGMNLPMDRFIVNIDRYANTSAASIPLALCEALADGRIKPTDTLLLVSFGAGLTWATAILQMQPKE